MSWLTTWPEANVPQYAEHATEAEAEAHAAQMVKAGVTCVCVWLPDGPSTYPRGAERGRGAIGSPSVRNSGHEAESVNLEGEV